MGKLSKEFLEQYNAEKQIAQQRAHQAIGEAVKQHEQEYYQQQLDNYLRDSHSGATLGQRSAEGGRAIRLINAGAAVAESFPGNRKLKKLKGKGEM